MIILNLIQNAALLMALVMTQQMLANSMAIRRLSRFPLIAVILSGFVFGGVGIIGMMTPLNFAPGIIFDGRSIILAVAGLFGGPVVAVVAASLCGAYRLWLGGAGALVGISVICEAAALGVVFHYLRKRNPRLMQYIPLLGFGFLVHVVMMVLMMMLPAEFRWDVFGRIGIPVLLVFPVATMLICRLFVNREENEKNKLALLESEKSYRELVENANSIILRWEPGGAITYFNDFAEKFFGFSQEEILGRQAIGTIIPERDSANHDLRAMVSDIALNPEKYAKNENENMRKDGSRVWISWTNKAIFDATGTVSEILCVGNDITERKRAEEALRESEEQHRTILQTAMDGFWLVRPDGRLEQVNEAYCLMSGYSEQELLAMSVPDLEAAETPEETAAHIQKVMAQGNDRFETRHRRRDGGIFDLEISLQCHNIGGGRISVFLRDITGRKQSERKNLLDTARQQAQLRIFNYKAPSIHDFLDYALSEVISLASSRLGFICLYDKKKQEFVLNTWSKEAMQECLIQDRRLVYQLENTGIWGEAVRQSKPIMVNDFKVNNPLKRGCPEGHVLLHRFLSLPVANNGNIVAVVGVANKDAEYDEDDILQLTLLMDAVWRIVERMQWGELLAAKNIELSNFNYTVSHDLKSPLVTIKTFLGYLEQDMANVDHEHVEQDLGYIHTAADKMNALLEELLDLSRIGRVVNPPVEAPLQTIVQEALDLVAGRIAERTVQVVVGQEPLMLYGDHPRLVEVFQNLVDNAVKFMGEQSEPQIEIGGEIKQGETVCFVRDNGMGIDPRHKEKLFGLFQKLDSSAQGTGLGLALVKRIVEVHGGRIWAESEGLGKGTCFYFTLPRKSSES